MTGETDKGRTPLFISGLIPRDRQCLPAKSRKTFVASEFMTLPAVVLIAIKVLQKSLLTLDFPLDLGQGAR